MAPPSHPTAIKTHTSAAVGRHCTRMMVCTRSPLLLLLLLLALQLAGCIDIGVLQAETGMPKKQQPGSKGRGSLLLGSLASGGAPAGGRLLREGLAPPVTALPFDKGELKRVAHQLRLRPPRSPPAPAALRLSRPLSHLLPPPLLCFSGSVCMLVEREREREWAIQRVCQE